MANPSEENDAHPRKHSGKITKKPNCFAIAFSLPLNKSTAMYQEPTTPSTTPPITPRMLNGDDQFTGGGLIERRNSAMPRERKSQEPPQLLRYTTPPFSIGRSARNAFHPEEEEEDEEEDEEEEEEKVYENEASFSPEAVEQEHVENERGVSTLNEFLRRENTPLAWWMRVIEERPSYDRNDVLVVNSEEWQGEEEGADGAFTQYAQNPEDDLPDSFDEEHAGTGGRLHRRRSDEEPNPFGEIASQRLTDRKANESLRAASATNRTASDVDAFSSSSSSSSNDHSLFESRTIPARANERKRRADWVTPEQRYPMYRQRIDSPRILTMPTNVPLTSSSSSSSSYEDESEASKISSLPGAHQFHPSSGNSIPLSGRPIGMERDRDQVVRKLLSIQLRNLTEAKEAANNLSTVLGRTADTLQYILRIF